MVYRCDDERRVDLLFSVRYLALVLGTVFRSVVFTGFDDELVPYVVVLLDDQVCWVHATGCFLVNDC